MGKLIIPCCIATKDIPDEETYNKIEELFLYNGKRYEDGYHYIVEEMWPYFGIDSDKDVIFFTGIKDYNQDDFCEEDVKQYSLQELLDLASSEPLQDVSEEKEGLVLKPPTVVLPEEDNAVVTDLDKPKAIQDYKEGELVRIISEKHSHGFEIGQIVVLSEYISVEDDNQYDESYWVAFNTEHDDSWHITESEFEPFMDAPDVVEKPSATLLWDNEMGNLIRSATQFESVDREYDLVIGNSSGEVKASVNVQVLIHLPTQVVSLGKDDAYKLYRELRAIFKEELRG